MLDANGQQTTFLIEGADNEDSVISDGASGHELLDAAD